MDNTKNSIKRVRNFLYSRIKEYQENNVQINPKPIFIIGHQKTGTSAIAGLLGEATGKSFTIDFFHKNDQSYPDFRRDLTVEKLTLQDFIKINKKFFSKDIVKEPELTFCYESLKIIFPEARFVFINRDPRSTIRSILNRLNISGKTQDLSKDKIETLDIPLGWKAILKGEFPAVKGTTFIEKLAHRWNLASDIYLSDSDNLVLIKYEDFVSDKIRKINELANKLNLAVIQDISGKVDFQYQPLGNRKISPSDFFSHENLGAINTICEERMKVFGYSEKSFPHRRIASHDNF